MRWLESKKDETFQKRKRKKKERGGKQTFLMLKPTVGMVSSTKSPDWGRRKKEREKERRREGEKERRREGEEKERRREEEGRVGEKEEFGGRKRERGRGN